MQLSSSERTAFYRRTGLSLAVFIFMISLAANVLFMVTRSSAPKPETALPPPPEESLLLEPQAYGAVFRGFVLRPQSTGADGTPLVPAASYVVPEGEFPSLTATLLLFRDQGVALDEAAVAKTFEELGVVLQWQDLELLPLTQRWRSADRTMEISLDIEKRALTVSRLGTFSAAPEGRADDDTSIAIAKDFAGALGVDVASFGSPVITDRTAEGGTRTYVVWPMIFGGLPLIDLQGQPVPAVQIQIGRLSRKALSATLTLLSPEHIVRSGYPRASNDTLSQGLLSGGILPVAKGLRGKAADVVYTELKNVYVLQPGDREFPTYIVPALLAAWTQGKTTGVTFVPALDPQQFSWVPAVGSGSTR